MIGKAVEFLDFDPREKLSKVPISIRENLFKKWDQDAETTNPTAPACRHYAGGLLDELLLITLII